MSAHDPFALGGRQDQADPDTAALRRACEEVAALYRAPLPGGDAGLVAAVQRWHDLRPLTHFEERGFNVTVQTEHDIVKPIATAAEIELETLIEETPAAGLAGVAAKLRYIIEGGLLDLEDVGGEQLVEVIERSIEPPLVASTGSGRAAT